MHLARLSSPGAPRLTVRICTLTILYISYGPYCRAEWARQSSQPESVVRITGIHLDRGGEPRRLRAVVRGYLVYTRSREVYQCPSTSLPPPRYPARERKIVALSTHTSVTCRAQRPRTTYDREFPRTCGPERTRRVRVCACAQKRFHAGRQVDRLRQISRYCHPENTCYVLRERPE